MVLLVFSPSDISMTDSSNLGKKSPLRLSMLFTGNVTK